jgi:hypothetical protein
MQKTCIDRRPTVSELKRVTDLPEKRFDFLMKHCYDATREGVELPLDLYTILGMLLHDWMHRYQVFSWDQQFATMLELGEAISQFCFEYVELEIEYPDRDHRPVCAFSIADNKYAIIGGGALPKIVYDVDEGKKVPDTDYHPLTILACDMSVMLLMAFASVEFHRDVREKAEKNDAKPAVSGESTGPASRGAEEPQSSHTSTA